MTTPTVLRFSDLNLPAPLLSALDAVGYEKPSPIQAQIIPPMLQGRDVLGNAPTGTGKTAAFALPLLARLNCQQAQVQVLVLTPTRELAIQVAEAFQRYAAKLNGFHVLPIYGGQEYGVQLKKLKRGVQVVVGTPGRVMDHIRRGTLQLKYLQALVLDEADEMLKMGFLEDVEWILEQIPEQRQMALFSATMPAEVKKIAQQHLHKPEAITIKARTATAETIRQRYWQVTGLHKLDALTRILEVEPFEAMLIFVRTKLATVELAERLEARGHAAAALNGDMAQKQREQMIEQLKKGSLDILVATDVAARGLDVERVSHVINYDIPYDTEAYIHRIGRTGRAGRQGDAILFVAPRERRMLNTIEKATRQKIELLQLPSNEQVNNQRIAGFMQRITDTLAGDDWQFMQGLVARYQQEHNTPASEIAAALAKMVIGNEPFLLPPEQPQQKRRPQEKRSSEKRTQEKPAGAKKSGRRSMPERPEKGMERYRIEVGHQHNVKPGNIVGAIANEAGLDAQYIGYIDIHDEYSLVDLPAGMPYEVYQDLRKAWVCGQKLRMTQFKPEPQKKSRKKAAKVT